MRNLLKFILGFFVVFHFAGVAVAVNPQAATARLYVDGVGHFALHSISSRILGTGCVSNDKFPDLFVFGDKYYKNECYRYAYVAHNEAETPVFEQKHLVKLPEEAFGRGVVMQYKKDIYLLWVSGKAINYGLYDVLKSTFVPKGSVALPELERPIKSFAAQVNEKGEMIIVYSSTVTPSSKAPGNWRKADYVPYDATGVWRGTFGSDCLYGFSYPEFLAGIPSTPVMISPNLNEIFGSSTSIALANHKGGTGVITGSSFGGVYYFNRRNDGVLDAKRHIVGTHLNALQHPTIRPTPVVYPNRKGENIDIIASGEGGVFFYRFTGKFSAGGKPIYDQPTHLLEKNPALYGGSLITPSVVDWNDDGTMDIICGNSAGHILYFENVGTNTKPSFRSGVYMKANGETIHIQPGYGQDIQGPGESRWGYIGANVFDWNNDGKLDILSNDARGRHTVFMGTDSECKLESGKSMFLNDLELHGTWRCRPGVGILDGSYVYITLDDQDDAHLYFREDNYNLTDGGKLLLTDGKQINANWLEAGGKGRLRFEIVDWDGDGVKDLLLATNKHHMIPDREVGLPWGHPDSLKGATLLFLRNAGSESKPSFEYPKQIKYKGELVRFGHHGCGASACFLGETTGKLPNVVVGDERGSLYLLERKFITW